MKESISYAFILNIMITFVFICFAVIMGIISYYRAFRANTAILNSLEKYEGYNCLSIAEIDRQLDQIGYKTPFAANKKSDGKGELITYSTEIVSKGYSIAESEELNALLPRVETNGQKRYHNYGKIGYSVMYYNYTNDELKTRKNINDQYVDEEYQFGTFTYMYLDIPIFNTLFKVPIFGKTNVLQEFRDIVEYGDAEKAEYFSKKEGREAALIQKINHASDRIKSRYKYEKLVYDRRMLLSENNVSLADFGLAPDDEIYEECTIFDQIQIAKGYADFKCDDEGYKTNLNDERIVITRVNNNNDNGVYKDVLQLAANLGTSYKYFVEPRIYYKADIDNDGRVNAVDATNILRGYGNLLKTDACGTFVNYKIYGGVEEVPIDIPKTVGEGGE